jgi:F-type H+-transporting ATPase subunit a
VIEHNPLIVDLVISAIAFFGKFLGFSKQVLAHYLPGYLILSVIATLMIIAFFKTTVKNLELFPKKMQYFLEFLYKAFRSMIDDVIGHEGRQFMPALVTLGIFIAVANLIGLLPELGSPTANLNVTCGCAVFIFIYYHYYGVKKHGLLKYLKTFMGPEWWLAPIFIPIEVISHFSRVLSLMFRLFGNIFGEDLIIIILALIAPWYIFWAPLPMMAFAVFTSFLQAFIFVMLSTMYLAGAIADEH